MLPILCMNLFFGFSLHEFFVFVFFFPTLPHHFSNGPSLTGLFRQVTQYHGIQKPRAPWDRNLLRAPLLITDHSRTYRCKAPLKLVIVVGRRWFHLFLDTRICRAASRDLYTNPRQNLVFKSYSHAQVFDCKTRTGPLFAPGVKWDLGTRLYIAQGNLCHFSEYW